jgi:DNA-binding transcriptional MocR family regulator
MEQILLTESGTHAVDLLCRFLLKPGDCVLVDDPSYFNYHALLKAHQVQAIGVPYTHSGPDLEAFAQHCRRIRRGCTSPTPACTTRPARLSASTAHRLLGLAERSELIIVEDDIFADFELQPAPRLAALDGLSRVIHVGSFSKTLSAASRCGYIAARHDWIEALTDLKLATSFGGGHLAAQLMHIALTDSGYRRHMQSIRSRLADARRHTLRKLQRWASRRGCSRKPACSCGASCPMAATPPHWRGNACARASCWRRATRSASRSARPTICASTFRSARTQDLAGAGAGAALSW